MWSIFGKSKEQKEQERILAEQKIIELKKDIKTIQEKASSISSKERTESWKDEAERNSTCPKCKSKNVNDRIKRQQGEIKGDFEGGGWSALTFGSSYSSGRIRGKMDTNEVNKCNDCQNEWKKHKCSYKYSDDIIEDELQTIWWHLEELYDARNCKFDKMDLKEPFNSLEEKKNSLMKKVKESYRPNRIKSFWNGTTLEALNYFAKEEFRSWQLEKWNKYYDEKELIELGFKTK